MNWEAVGAIGEVTGAILILVTLVYLSIQIRQNTIQQKREELVSVQHGQNTVVGQLRDPQVFGAYVRTAEDRQPTIEDRGTSFAWVLQYLNHFQVVHELYRTGALDEEQFQLWLGYAVAVVAPKGIRRWWDEENGRLAFHSEVHKSIDSRLSDSENVAVPLTRMWSQFNADAWERVPRGGNE